MRLVLFMLLMGCGSGAIVTTHDGRYLEGRIGGHDRGYVFIAGERVPRSNVEDIDHPGNVAALLGSIVAGLGALSATSNCKEENRAADPTPCTSSGIWMLTGIPIAIYGFVTHAESVSRAGE